MFIRHFEWRKGEPTYTAYVNRYHEFHKDDIAYLCYNCHEAMHHLYMPYITEFAGNTVRRKLRDFTWRMAGELIEVLEQVCNHHLERGYDARRVIELSGLPDRRTSDRRRAKHLERSTRPKRRSR